MNLCCACLKDFASVKAFDAHRVGRHPYSFAEGLERDPPVEDGRRCLDVDEIGAAGMELDGRGRWYLVGDAERIRRHRQEAVSEVGIRPETASGSSGRPDGRLEARLRIPEAPAA